MDYYIKQKKKKAYRFGEQSNWGNHRRQGTVLAGHGGATEFRLFADS